MAFYLEDYLYSGTAKHETPLLNFQAGKETLVYCGFMMRKRFTVRAEKDLTWFFFLLKIHSVTE